MMTKSTVHSHPHRRNESKNSTKPGDPLHTDLVSEVSVPSVGGSKYYVTMYDDATGASMIRVMKRKSDAFKPFTDMANSFSTLFEKPSNASEWIMGVNTLPWQSRTG